MTPARWRDVTRVYAAVVARDPAARDEALAAACGSDAELRREVEALLAEDSGATILDRPLAESAAAVGLADLTGRLLGPYRIDAAIGAGGMGQVYRAIDTRLQRTVAIKILPAELSTDPQFRARFDREAKAIAALNDPHICALYDVGSDAGIDYLVLEHLEGQTLESRLERGPLPLAQALQTSIEIAEALAAAHRRGIVHRDLKPGNVMLTKAGVKLLDFGLAKAQAAAAFPQLSMMPTTPPNLTAQGTILGTFQYMAPEQLEGREADARTDIFALGVMIYELVTGKKAFDGKSQASLIGAIMHADPAAMAETQPLTPPAVERLVRTCLAKDPDQRWQSAADLARELRWVSESPGMVATPAIGRTKIHRLLVTLAFIGGIVIGFAGAWTRPAAHDNSVKRFVIEMPPSHDLYTGGGSRPVFSPDGKSLVYPGVPATGGVMLFRRAFDQLIAQPIPGTENATNPFFSPDRRFLVFGGQVSVADDAGKVGGLRKLDMSTGSVMTLLRCPRRCRGGFWAPDDTIWFSDEGGDSGVIAHVPAAGGLAARIPHDATVGRDDLYPQLLPGGKGVLTTEVSRGVVGTTLASAHVTAISVESGQRHVLYEGAGAQYTPTGHLVFARGNTLFAVPFDVAQLKANGTPVPVVENVQVNSGGLALFAFSNDGTLAYVPGVAGTSRSLAWINRQGREEPITGMPERSYVIPQLSPDGRRIALDVRDQSSDIYVWDVARRQLSRVTSDPVIDGFPVWSPDSRRIAFASTRGGAMNLFLQDVDGTNAERLTRSANTQIPIAFSHDGGQLFFLESTTPGGTKLRQIALAGARHDDTVIEWSTQVTNVSIAPDESWVAYQLNDSGQDEIFVQPIRGATAERHQISTGGGTRPLWGGNGHDIFYIGGDNRLTSVRIQTAPSFTATEPTSILPARYYSTGPGRTYDVSREGDRFLMIKETGARGQSAQIVVVQNWFTELQQRVPVK